MSVEREVFGKTKDGQEVHAYRVILEDGSFIRVLDYGAILQSVTVPDRNGKLTDVALGYDTIAPYETNPCFFGATIGRCGNRIKGAAFSLEGKNYQMQANENGNNLHSGPDGFEKRLWNAQAGEDSVSFSLHSPDGDEGFPGNADFTVTYTFTPEHEVRIHYQGMSDRTTVMNLTNHSYWNLNGEGGGTIFNHSLQIMADGFTPVDKESIPTGEVRPVAGTPFDFREMKPVGEDAAADEEQLAFTGGYDHNFALNGSGWRTAAKVSADISGISMEVMTDLPGIQFYAGNFISGAPGKMGHEYQAHSGLALETQYFPDSVNKQTFAQPIVRAGEAYESTTSYLFRN